MADLPDKGFPESIYVFKCLTDSCECEATKSFADHPEALFCSDCFRRINHLRLRRMVST